MVQETAKSPDSFIEIHWEESEIVKCLVKYSRISLLHYYIAATIAVYYRQEYRANNDLMELKNIRDVEYTFQTYGIKYQPFDRFRATTNLVECESLGEKFYEWFVKNEEDSFIPLWDCITDVESMFSILFIKIHVKVYGSQVWTRGIS